jgi:hypothetical protein
MQNAKRKSTIIAIFLILSMATSIAFLPSASAHTPQWKIPTFAYVTALPDPVGVGQQTLIYLWLNQVFGAGFDAFGQPISSASLINNYRFHNYQLIITDPNGENTTKAFDTIQDTTSSVGYYFTPTIVGTYKLTFNFPGQDYNQYAGGYNPASVLVNDTYLPSSATGSFTVQNDKIASYPDSYPLPQEYWARPIYGENPFWWAISSNWLGTGSPVNSAVGSGTLTGFTTGAYVQRYPGDAIGPQTAHIMWTKPLQSSGGVVGGNNYAIQGDTYFEGSAYTNRFQNPIIMNGRIFFQEPISYFGTVGPVDCVDLRTGKLIWSRIDVPAPSFGYIYDHQDPDQHGVFPAILATANFARLFDADTGTQLFNVTGVPSGALAQGPQGEQMRYVFTNVNATIPGASPDWRLARWNSSKLWNYGINPYTGGSLLYPSILNASAVGDLNPTTGAPNTNASLQALISTVPVPQIGTTGTLSNSTPAASYSVLIPYNSNLVVNGGIFDSRSPQNRYDWNVTVPWLNVMGSQTVLTNTTFANTTSPTQIRGSNTANPVTVVATFYDNMLICRNGSLPAAPQSAVTFSWTPYTYFGVNLNASKGNVGDIMWMKTYDPPSGNVTVEPGLADPTAGVFVESIKETMQWVGYSMKDGSRLWTTPSQTVLDYYGAPFYPFLAGQLAYGKLYSAEYGGIVYCYDLTNGNLLWTYGNGGAGNSTESGFQVPGRYPTFINAVGNGILYILTTEHTPETPIYKGALVTALNATDGTEMWKLNSYVGEFAGMSFAIADGFATFFNGYDNQVYSVGKGPSATTISAPDLGLSFGTPVVIKGTVMDIATGTKQDQQAARFPNGVPAMSDASMTDWMGYVYQQKPFPTNVTGVEVTLRVLDSNNNFREIGTVTTDSNGFYSLAWTPDIAGSFKVYASFAGTNAYWPSNAVSAFNIMEAPPTPPPSGEPPTSMTDTYVAAFGIAILIAVIIVGIAIVFVLRKK